MIIETLEVFVTTMFPSAVTWPTLTTGWLFVTAVAFTYPTVATTLVFT